MADKKITDLNLRSDFDATVNLPGDDTSQTWRVTGGQISTFIKSELAITPIGAAGTRYRSDGTNPAWGHEVVQTLSTTGTMAANTDFLICDGTSGAFTVTLPTVVNDKIIKIMKSDSTFNRITLGAVGTLNTVKEIVWMIGISGSWVIFDRKWSELPVTFTPTIYGATSNPTKASGAVELASWSRISLSHMLYQYTYTQGAITGANSGSGAYIWGLPTGLTPNGSFVDKTSFNAILGVCGPALFRTNAATSESLAGALVYDNGSGKSGIYLSGFAESGGSTLTVAGSSTTGFAGHAILMFSFTAHVPVAEWIT
jgi:hypothetical protein